MPYETAKHSRDAYRLLSAFVVPEGDGPKMGISVTASWANALVGLYSIMLEALLIHAWMMILSVLILLSPRTKKDKSRVVVFKQGNGRGYFDALADLWPWETNRRGSRMQRQRRTATDARLSRLWWIFIIVLAWLVPKGLPIFLVLPLQIGQNVPVSADFIYIPFREDITSDNNWAEKDINIHKPAALRALAVAQVADEKLLGTVKIDGPRDLSTTEKGQPVQVIDYAFNLSTADLGLSKFKGPLLQFRGSCYTEYGWYKGASANYSETYNLFGHTNRTHEVPHDGWAPLASFVYGPAIDSPQGRNRTFAIFVSSFDRWSISPSTDPLYATGTKSDTNPDQVSYQVQRERPALNCWSQNSWRHKDQGPVGTWDLADVPDLDMSKTWRLAFWQLFEISLANVGEFLDSIALASSEHKGLYAIDAASCSMKDDVQRLVLTTRIYMANALVDTTLYNRSLVTGEGDKKGYTNLLTKDMQKELAYFVLNAGEDATTLDVAFLAAVPCVQLVVFALTWLLRHFANQR
jgi:hypothetical protein